MEVKNLFKNKIAKLNKHKLKCPTCKKQPSNRFMPFCSKKCSDVDLMKWLSDENCINLD